MSGSSSGTTAVPSPTFGPNGFVAPPESSILTGVQTDINAAFGGGLNPSLSTPQGQLASSESAIIGDTNAQFLALANGVDPSYAQGRMQDAIGRIYFITRIPAQATVNQGCVCSGRTGVVIPAGTTLGQDLQGNLYAPLETGTISSAGTVTLDFGCLTTGPIACAPGAMSLYGLIPGLDSVTNPTAGVIGRNVETRSQFETRRKQSVALNSRNTNAAILGLLLQTSGVTDAYVIDNSSNSTQTIGGVAISPNSLYVAAVGGADASVAQVIWSKKPPGCPYQSGTTTITVQDTTQPSTPYPSYSVIFTRPTSNAIAFNVEVVNSTSVPSDALTLVQNAISYAFSGSDGGPRATIGSTIYASRFYSTIAALGPWAQIVRILVGTHSGGATGDSVGNTIAQIPTLASSDVTLTLI